MSSRFPAVSLLALLALAGCDRENRESRGQPLPETAPFAETSDLQAGQSLRTQPDPRAAMYEGNAFHIGEGQRLFSWMNCTGCHAHGGGGMGPPLMDDEWRYGGRMEQIAATIVHGRPNGMPSFRGKITEQQMWQLAAYVRSISGQVPKDAAPSRGDDVANIEPMTLKEKEATLGSDPASVAGTTQ
jgi:cytochrome c oxidase cbb3-type subunit 3